MSYGVLKNRLTNGSGMPQSTILQALIAFVESKIDEGTEKEVME